MIIALIVDIAKEAFFLIYFLTIFGIQAHLFNEKNLAYTVEFDRTFISYFFLLQILI